MNTIDDHDSTLEVLLKKMKYKVSKHKILNAFCNIWLTEH